MRRLLLLLLLLVAVPAFAAPKLALVVAVGQYRAVATLANPPRDAQLVGAALRSAGFAVTPLIDPDRAALVAALSAFRQRAVGAEAAIIYFAGHGVEVEGANLLLPTDVLAGSPDEVKLSAINARQLASAVGPASRLRLVVLDACRDNPFAVAPGATRSLGTSRGLAREAISGVVTILATQAGQRAEDRSKLSPANSPFARAFAEVISQAGLEVVRLPTRLARAMAAGDGIAQQPDQIGIWLDDEYRLRAAVAVALTSPSEGSAVVTGGLVPLVPVRQMTSPALFTNQGARGYAGLAVQGMTGDIANGLGLPRDKGAIIASVEADGPAARAGLRRGDIVLAINDQPVNLENQIGALISGLPVGVTASFDLLRAGNPLRRTMMIVPRPAESSIGTRPALPEIDGVRPPRDEPAPAVGPGRAGLGLTLQALTPAVRKQLRLTETVQGVVVAGVNPASDAARKGLQRGDVIIKIGNYLLGTPADAAVAVESERRAGRDTVLLLVQRGAAAARFLGVETSMP